MHYFSNSLEGSMSIHKSSLKHSVGKNSLKYAGSANNLCPNMVFSRSILVRVVLRNCCFRMTVQCTRFHSYSCMNNHLLELGRVQRSSFLWDTKGNQRLLLTNKSPSVLSGERRIARAINECKWSFAPILCVQLRNMLSIQINRPFSSN